jgi:hypothetical protein
MKIKKNQILIITDGQYSDYEILGLFKTKIDIDFNAKMKSDFLNWQKGKTTELSKYFFGNPYIHKDIFIRYLLEKKLIDEIDYSEFNLLDFG